MIISKLRFLIPAVVLLAFACSFVDAAKMTQKQKFAKAIKNELTKKNVSAQRLEAALREQIRIFTKSLKKDEMANALETANVPAKFQGMVDGIVAEIKPAPKVPPLSATVTAKIKDIQDKFELVVTTELDKFPVSKKGKDKRRYVKNHLKQVNDALNAVAWNDFRLFGKDGKPYAGTMKKNDGTILLSTDIPDEGVFAGDLDGLDTTAVKAAAVQAVTDAVAEKAGKKAKSGTDKAKAAAAELTALKNEIDGEITKLEAEIKAGSDLIAKVHPKATPLLVKATPAQVTAYADTKAALTKAITDATKVDFNANKDALNVPGAPAAGDLVQLKADIAAGKILKADVIAATKAINDAKGPFNAAYKALKPAKAPVVKEIKIKFSYDDGLGNAGTHDVAVKVDSTDTPADIALKIKNSLKGINFAGIAVDQDLAAGIISAKAGVVYPDMVINTVWDGCDEAAIQAELKK